MPRPKGRYFRGAEQCTLPLLLSEAAAKQNDAAIEHGPSLGDAAANGDKPVRLPP